MHGYSLREAADRLTRIPSFHAITPSGLLQDISFFNQLPDESLAPLYNSIYFSEYMKDKVICRQGKFDGLFFIILSGSVRATITTDDEPGFELYTLKEDDFFGEGLVFSSEVRETTITATADLITLSMDRETLLTIMEACPSIKTLMDSKYIERKLRRDLRRIDIFTHLDDTLFEDLLHQVSLLSLKENSTIFHENDPGEAFYLIRKGEVAVSRRNNEGQDETIAILGEGEFFGEMALVNGEKRNATITTIQQTDLVRLTRNTFLDVIEKDSSVSALLLDVIERRTELQHSNAPHPSNAIIKRQLLDLNREVNIHLDILSQCTIDTELGSALLASLPESRYPYVYPRDSACASRFLYTVATSSLKAGELAFRYLSEIARFIRNCQRSDGYWGQRYGISGEDKGIYKQEDNVAHGVTILCRYLLSAIHKDAVVKNLNTYLEAIVKGAEFARKNYYRNEIHLFYSTTSIHESAIEEGYSIWVNYSYLLMLNLMVEVAGTYNCQELFAPYIELKKGFEQSIENVFAISDRYVRRLKPDGTVDLRADITLLSPFFFGTGMEKDAFVNNELFSETVNFMKDTLWDPDLGMLQRYLPFIEDPDTHIHAGNGPWLQYTAILAQYYFYTGNERQGMELLSILQNYMSKEGYLCEHLTTPERFYEFKRLEWISGNDAEKEFDSTILVDGITYDNIVEELNHMKNAYQDVESQARKLKNDHNAYITFATPLMWSHTEYAMALILQTMHTIEELKQN